MILFAAFQCLRTPDGIDAELRDCWPQSFQHNTAHNLIQQLTTGRKAASETELSVEAAVWYLIAIFGQLPQTSVSRQRDGGHFMKIQWNFADGTTSEVEVNEELGTFITASRREEDNLSRKETYMNANKAVELGFADGILEDAKRDHSDDVVFAFSRRAVTNALFNKLITKHAPKAEQKKPDAPTGVSITEAMQKLQARKYI
jgi:hypothetical protein